MKGDVLTALKRKLGPLPAWAWAGIGAAGLYLYRRRSGASSSSVPAALSPDVTDQSGGLRDPITLQPGERVYDPNSGKIVGGDDGSGQTGGGDSTGGGGGDSTGGGGGDGTQPGPTNPPVPPHGHPGKRKPKAKPKHRKAVKGPGFGVRRPRIGAAVRGKRNKPGAGGSPFGHPKAPRGRGVKAAAHKPPAPGRGHGSASPKVALRQRPAAPKVVNHAEQKVQPHPAAPPKGAAKAPVQHPAQHPTPPVHGQKRRR